jgi:succinate dehydrogenase/fumarate reductase flavoprotein subunit
MNHTEHQIATSVLVIGTGGAGLRSAIELAERGVDVLAVGKRPKSDAHTTLAAGGINAALATMDPEDSWQQHAADTLKESYLLADPETVRIVTENAARGIGDLERYGMPFAREADGKISQRFFGARTPTAAPRSPVTTPGWRSNAHWSTGRYSSTSRFWTRSTSRGSWYGTTSSSALTDSTSGTASGM